MKKGRVGWILIGLLLVGQLAAQPVGVLNQITDTVACRKWVDEQLQTMTLKQKIGQLFIHTVAPIITQRNKENIATAIKEYGIGGLLFSGGDVRKQIALTNMAQRQSKIPLMVTFDGEWGLAMRLKGTPSFPKNRVLGCIGQDSLLYAYGREVARQLHEIGVHVNFAPVADVDNNPDNPVINVRSFGSDPENVSRKVIAYMRGLQDGGIIAVCKHFPGHGDTDVDSHKFLPRLEFSRERLDSIELYPFREAVAAGINGVMVGHLEVPELGIEPASVSPDIVKKTLRGELGFQGLVFTDALEMKGIAGHEDVCAKALIAGNDLLLAPRNLKKSMAGVLEAVKKGKLTEEEITEHCRKVLTYKYALGLVQTPEIVSEGLEKRLSTPETTRLIENLQQASVTVAKDDSECLPLDLSLSGNVLLSISESLAEDYPFYKELREKMSLAWVRASRDSLKAVENRLRPAQRIIVAIHSSKVDAYDAWLQKLAADKPLVLVCFEPQKVLEKLPQTVSKADAVILAHDSDDKLQRYVARVLLGKEAVNGRLSIPLGKTLLAGAGISIDPNTPRAYQPEDFGMDAAVLAQIDSIAWEGIRNGAYPGCHILIQKCGYPVYNKCFGTHTYEEDTPVRENDLYDLASLSKTTGTLLAVMKLYDEGKFGLTDKISKFIPELRKTNKESLTVQDLLFHESGLPAYLPFYMKAIDLKSCKGGLFRKKRDANHQVQVDANLYACTSFSYKPEYVSDTCSEEYPLQVADGIYLKKEFRKVVLDEIVKAPLKGHSYRYSCLNFMLPKEMVEAISGVPMDVFLDSVFYRPMGLTHIAYNTLCKFEKSQIVHTVKEDLLR
ncbi:MAG: serine hydrolase, partial [Bacteroides sp.]|nr:serine hydrolase [Bacteroides sp.]